MSKSLLAAPHSMCELRALLCKTVITIADILLKPVPKVQVVLYCMSCGLLFYWHARMVSGKILLVQHTSHQVLECSSSHYLHLMQTGAGQQ